MTSMFVRQFWYINIDYYIQYLHFLKDALIFFQITEETSKTDGSLDDIRCILQKTAI